MNSILMVIIYTVVVISVTVWYFLPSSLDLPFVSRTIVPYQPPPPLHFLPRTSIEVWPYPATTAHIGFDPGPLSRRSIVTSQIQESGRSPLYKSE